MSYLEYCEELTQIMNKVIDKYKVGYSFREELLKRGDLLIFKIFDKLESIENYKEYFFMEFDYMLSKRLVLKEV